MRNAISGQRFEVRWPRWRTAFACVFFGGLSFVILDGHVFHLVPGLQRNISNQALPLQYALAGVGIVVFVGGLWQLIRPTLLMDAGPAGIRFYFGKKAGIICIPWQQVTALAEGRMRWTTGIGQRTRAQKARALLIACDSSANLDQFCSPSPDFVSAVSHDADHRYVLLDGPEKPIPGHEGDDHLAVNASYFPISLDETLQRLTAMKARYSET